MRIKPPTSASSSGPEAQIVVSSGGHTATAPASSLVPLRLKVKRVLVPCDFSKHSAKALDYALGIARQFGSEVIVANVVEDFMYPGDSLLLPRETYFAQRQEENLAKLKELTKGTELKVTYVIKAGSAWQEIVRAAKDSRADVIVIATHGRTGLKHVFMGSVAERVVRHAPCPVLVIRPENRDFRPSRVRAKRR